MSQARLAIFLRAVLVLILIGTASSMSALANRVFVSARSGNDANSCDNIATPCQTFAGAVLQLNAGGEAIVLDSGGYGKVTITQSLTIEAPPGVLAFIHPSSGDAITINAGSGDTVVLRGLTLNGGSNNGITVNSVGTLFVENCAISGFASYGIQMTAGALDMKNTDVKGCYIGVQITNVSGTVTTASIDHCHLDGNADGFRAAADSPSALKATATNSTANNNSQYGWYCGAGTDGTVILNLEFCTGSGNDVGLLGQSLSASSVARYSNCVFSNNASYGVMRTTAGTLESRTNNTITGNGIAPTFGVIGSFSAM